MSKVAAKPGTEQAQQPTHIVVRTTHGKSFRRGGILFSPNPTTLAISDLKPEQYQQIIDEHILLVEYLFMGLEAGETQDAE